ncbi:MAG: MBL fold metallo-hydrolase [Myxococcaceae bacterium]|nr:MBL fold metallo-hydrolase [Myxococcaceae bacterium]
MRGFAVLCLLLTACAASDIRVPDEHVVAGSRAKGRGVEVCVLMQERWPRARFEGVAELSFARWDYGIASVLVKHPDGLVVIDPAFGRDVVRDLARAPMLFRLAMGPTRLKRPLRDVMEEAGLDPEAVTVALPTHVHWDHVGALGDLPNARVLLPRAELEWANTLKGYLDGGAMPHHLARAKERLRLYEFDGPARDGFPSSFDVFNDGSIVAVPLPGHTPGHTAFLVKLVDGRSALFVGDASWAMRGVEAPVHKLIPLDHDHAQTGESLGLLHALWQHRKDVLVIPAHDAAAHDQLPSCVPPPAPGTVTR